MLTGGNGELYFDCRVPYPLFVLVLPHFDNLSMQAIERVIEVESAHITERVTIDSKVAALRLSVSFLGDHQGLSKKLKEYPGIRGTYEFPIEEKEMRKYRPVMKAAAQRFNNELANTARERYAFHKYKPMGY